MLIFMGFLMKKNVGKVDLIVRIVAGIIIGALGLIYQSWWGLVAIVPFATAAMGFCPFWTIFGINTCTKK